MKKFKKIAALVLAMVLAMPAFAIAATGENELGFVAGAELPAFGSATGEVVEFWQNDLAGTGLIRIRRAEVGYFDFIVDANTFLLGREIEIGDKITGFFDNYAAVAMIYPPRHMAVVLLNRGEDTSPRIIVDRFDENWISSANQFRLNIGEETEIVFQGGDAFEGEIVELIGRKLVVEFFVSHRDIPETIPNPVKITILYERAVHPTIEIDRDYDPWHSVLWWSEDSDPANYDIIITLFGMARGVPNARHATLDGSEFPNYVPLRPIAEILGFATSWNAARREITVGSPRGEIRMQAGSRYYTLTTPAGITITTTLDAPRIIGGRTYVPLQFFSEIFGFNNAWWSDGNVALDNFERME